jgi:hypothetical protein
MNNNSLILIIAVLIMVFIFMAVIGTSYVIGNIASLQNAGIMKSHELHMRHSVPLSHHLRVPVFDNRDTSLPVSEVVRNVPEVVGIWIYNKLHSRTFCDMNMTPQGYLQECTGSVVSFPSVNIATTHDNNVYSFISTTNTRVYLMRKSQDLANRMRLINTDQMPVLTIQHSNYAKVDFWFAYFKDDRNNLQPFTANQFSDVIFGKLTDLEERFRTREWHVVVDARAVTDVSNKPQLNDTERFDALVNTALLRGSRARILEETLIKSASNVSVSDTKFKDELVAYCKEINTLAKGRAVDDISSDLARSVRTVVRSEVLSEPSFKARQLMYLLLRRL